MKFTWLVTNEATHAMVAKRKLANPIQVCLVIVPSLKRLNSVNFVPITCSILIANGALPFAEPSFTLTLEGEGVSLTKTVGLLVGENEVAGWSVERIPEIQKQEMANKLSLKSPT